MVKINVIFASIQLKTTQISHQKMIMVARTSDCRIAETLPSKTCHRNFLFNYIPISDTFSFARRDASRTNEIIVGAHDITESTFAHGDVAWWSQCPINASSVVGGSADSLYDNNHLGYCHKCECDAAKWRRARHCLQMQVTEPMDAFRIAQMVVTSTRTAKWREQKLNGRKITTHYQQTWFNE